MQTLTPCGGDDLPQLTAAIALGGWVHLSAGTFKPSAAVPVNNPVMLTGEGIGSTFILSPSSASDVFDINCLDAVKFSDFTIQYAAPGTAGTQAIKLCCPNTPPYGQYGNSSSVFRDLRIENAYIAINIFEGAYYIIENLKSINHAYVGIWTQNINWADAGDSIIANCTILGASGALAGIVWQGGGAISIINNKVLTHQYGMIALMQAGAQTRQMQITGNSFDGANVAAVSFWPLGAGTFGGVIIANNIFNLAHRGISAPTPPSGKWINSMIDLGNNWYPDGVAGAVYSDFSAVTTPVSVNNVNY